jgi:hypothetical protein
MQKDMLMPTISDDASLFDDDGKPLEAFADAGQEVVILAEKLDASNAPWTKVRLIEVDGEPEGWVPSAKVNKEAAVVVPIVKKEFAKECMRQAVRFGTYGHYLLAVAHLRSKISSGSNGDKIGPFRLTQNEWDANRTDSIFELNFESRDIRHWPSQCAVFASMAKRAQEAILLLQNGERPSAVALYLAQMIGAKAAFAILKDPAKKVDAAMNGVAPDDLPAGAGTPAEILERYAGVLKDNNQPASGQKVFDQVAAALKTALDETKDLAVGAGAVELSPSSPALSSDEGNESDVPGGGVEPPPVANASFEAFFEAQFPGNAAFAARDFLVKGAKHAINGLNTDPPQPLWPNIVKLVGVLTELKTRLGNPQFRFNSVYRSPAYNESVGGAGGSFHMKFCAADIAVAGKTPIECAQVVLAMRNEGFFKGGVKAYATFVHVDTRGYNANW